MMHKTEPSLDRGPQVKQPDNNQAEQGRVNVIQNECNSDCVCFNITRKLNAMKEILHSKFEALQTFEGMLPRHMTVVQERALYKILDNFDI